MQIKQRSNSDFRFITNAAGLSACVADLREGDSVALDLEFDSHRNAYGTTMCLIQLATTDACYIVDPLAGLELRELYAVFEAPEITKIVHSPGEDLRVLHSLGCIPQTIFDTEVAAKLLNYEHTSLSSMLFAKLGLVLNKGQQRSNWMRRPLSAEQLTYAADDVLHLHGLKAALTAECSERGILPMVLDEQTVWSTTSYAQEEKDFFLKGPDLHLSPYDQYVLNEIFRYRDDLARALKKPAFQVMDEQVVRRLADGSLAPADLPATKGIYGGYANKEFGVRTAAHLSAIKSAAKDKELSPDLPPRLVSTPAQRAAKAQADRDRTQKFAPLQAALAARFGEYAARFILSKGKADEILRKNIFISGLKPAYKPALILETAAGLGIDLTEYV